MKAYTDIEQSKKLTKILPLESADMSYDWFIIGKEYSSIPQCRKFIDDELPCWSLTALLDYIKDKCGYFELVYLSSTIDGRVNRLENVYRFSTDVYDVYKKEAIDACYEMVLKLHEQKLL